MNPENLITFESVFCCGSGIVMAGILGLIIHSHLKFRSNINRWPESKTSMRGFTIGQLEDFSKQGRKGRYGVFVSGDDHDEDNRAMLIFQPWKRKRK